ncbi:cytoplasmic protein [Rickenella mellea]|uniref:Cytoplasmic protein n=1 Tax=Rickenella mellea TaxID=50990 RepID=A0A4Y7QDZ3_9AGAM|nr:cytoplasmic protein [Rickenella mellea]
MPPSPSSSRALGAILPQIASGQAYEAHQKARTFAARYVQSQQYDTAIDVLFQSARELLKAGQLGSGNDLSLFLLEVYDAKQEDVNIESRGRITQLIALTGPTGSWRKTLIDRSVAWTSRIGPYPGGDPELHQYIAELLHKEGAFETAEPHFLLSGTRDSARLFAQMMSQWWQSTGSSASPGAFALRGTLPYLQNGNILAARTFLSNFISLSTTAKPSLLSSLTSTPLQLTIAGSPSEGDEIVLTTDPTLNFLQLAVRTCQRAQGDRNKQVREAWIRLCGTYQSKGGLLAKPEVRMVLSELSTLYFAIPPPRNQAANPFGDMLSSLFGGAPTGAPAPRVLAPGGSTSAGLD